MVANSLLNFLEDVKKRFNEFYAKVYVDKVSLFHDKISKYNLSQLEEVLGEKLGPELCKVILKLHIGTGCDYLCS